ncbi:hypothetical protein [Phaffia rhodozyma]|uniref:Uncharacterized protein n=1 Tax=Phaffia rhodozyma TaxID=264483 RepID=A0A0F7SME4_PHARH|nr:hypothetical protein [Phaffia rhodozyma]
MDLYPGQSAKFEISCNRQFTKYRDPTNQSPLGEYACDTVGPLHTVLNFGEAVDDSKFGGCALAIAYESDVKKLKPEDFTIFSVNHSCVWYREISFEVPQDLPECDDEKGCHCTWNWIHTANNQNAEGRGEGYPFEMYQNMYRCRINNATGVQPVLTGKVAAECINGNGTETSGCLDGPKTPFVWSQAEGDNIVSQVCLSSLEYGFQNGAQNDIFDTKPDDDDDDNDDKDDNDKDKDEDEGEAKKDEDQKEGKPEDASGQPPYSPHESIDETGWAVPEISIGIPLVGSTLGFFLGRV